MENKAFSAITIKAVHEEKREIEGIASTPAVDRVNDIVEPLGLSFTKDAPLLLNHDHKQPVGTVQFGAPTAKGLPFRASIPKVNEPGVVKDRTDEAWHSVKSGIIRGVSIGFMPTESKALSNGGTRFIKANVHELSLVAVPANPEATITAFKALAAKPAPSAAPTQTPEENLSMKKAVPAANTIASQIRKAVAKGNEAAYEQVNKASVSPTYVPPASTTNNPALVYATQAPGVLLPPTTTSLIETLSKGGAANLPPNTRLLTQAALLTAVPVSELAPIPAAAPDIDFQLTSTERKFGLIIVVTNEMVAPGNVNNNVVAYIEQQLTDAANNATDGFFIGLMDTGGTAAASVTAAMSAFVGDLRSAVWIASPETLASLQDAANPNLGPLGGTYKTLPALPSLAAEPGKLYLLDRKRVAVFDGPMVIERSDTASIVMDTAPGSASTAPTNLYQMGMTALKVLKYADAKLLSAPQVITL